MPAGITLYNSKEEEIFIDAELYEEDFPVRVTLTRNFSDGENIYYLFEIVGQRDLESSYSTAEAEYICPIGRVFKGMSHSSEATEAEYAVGTTFTLENGDTLYTVETQEDLISYWIVNNHGVGRGGVDLYPMEFPLTVTVTSSGAVFSYGVVGLEGAEKTYTYIYEGEGTFKGLAIITNSTDARYSVGDTFTITDPYFEHTNTLYIVTGLGVKTFYNGSTLASLTDGRKATLHCNGTGMESDVVVKVGGADLTLTPTYGISYERSDSLNGYGLNESGAMCTGIIVGEYDSTFCKDMVISAKYDGAEVKAIKYSAFAGYRSITSVKIPSSVKVIGSNAFKACTSLKYVQLPLSVVDIFDGAFSECTSITYVSISPALKRIRNGVFQNCTGITSLIIPTSITHIDNEAFSGCTSLGTIKYEGTTSQWAMITRGTNWALNVPATEVICSDGKCALDSTEIKFYIDDVQYTAEAGIYWCNLDCTEIGEYTIGMTASEHMYIENTDPRLYVCSKNWWRLWGSDDKVLADYHYVLCYWATVDRTGSSWNTVTHVYAPPGTTWEEYILSGKHNADEFRISSAGDKITNANGMGTLQSSSTHARISPKDIIDPTTSYRLYATD